MIAFSNSPQLDDRHNRYAFPKLMTSITWQKIAQFYQYAKIYPSFWYEDLSGFPYISGAIRDANNRSYYNKSGKL